jgi:hypothetical protein
VAVIHAASAILFGLRPGDAFPYTLGAAIVGLCSGAALWLPARRASVLDPSLALRQD